MFRRSKVVVESVEIGKEIATKELKLEPQDLEWKILNIDISGVRPKFEIEFYEKRVWDLEFSINPRKELLLKLHGGAISVSELKENFELRKLSFEPDQIKEIHKSLLRDKMYNFGPLENLSFPSKHGYYELEHEEGTLILRIKVYPPFGIGRRVKTKQVLQELEEMKVVLKYVDMVALDRILKEMNGNGIIAYGKFPVKGKDGFINWFVKEPTCKPKVLPDGRVDFKSIDLFVTVRKGDELLKLEKAIPGKAGEDIYGNEIPAPEVKEVKLTTGANVEWDGSILKAAKSGYVLINHKENKVAVKDVLEVDEVGLATGNIEFDGIVKVKGDIKTGYKVVATDGVEVLGNIEEAIVETDGHIKIKGGFIGGEKGIIKAGDVIKAKFINGGIVIAGGNIVIDSYAMHCKILGGSEIFCIHEKGALVGGDFKARYAIIAKEYGSKLGVKTRVSVGYDPRFMDEVDTLSVKYKNLEKALQTLQNRFDVLILKVKNHTINAEEKKELVEVKKNLDILKQEKDKTYEALKQATVNMYNSSVVDSPKCRIDIVKVAHLNTFFKIGKTPLAVTKYPLTTTGIKIIKGQLKLVFPRLIEKKIAD